MSSIPGDLGAMPIHVISGEPEVADRHGKVIVRYADVLVAMDPQFARALSDKLLRVAYKVQFGDYPAVKSNMQLERIRATLVVKVERMVDAAMRDHVAPKVQAARIIDTVMQDLA